ncbi:hypothetical protein [Sphingobacterium spiritivorum]|uniref:hypothetical protein n=1 Tax=Sphingobacterium spiritivorum TaxID=258 RepID=UPI00191A6E2E|nr:hypothetical protein [Sphingobacterium spiritivorum]QQT26167.1 hypothetical protein I6J02_21120 [Sphingobacterium spiritivorum]
MKIFELVLLLLLCNSQVFGQKTQETLLIESFLDTGDDAKEGFTDQLRSTLENYDIKTFNNFRRVLDSLNSYFTIKNSEKGDYELFTLTNEEGHWSYVLRDKVIINRSEKTFNYFYDIHNLPNKEYLLIKRSDEMSFSCSEAFIYNGNIKYDYSDIFTNGSDGKKVLSVYSWTNVDESYPGKIDTETGREIVEGGLKSYKPIEIEFDPEKQLIFYSFHRMKDGRKITRKAKYRNSDFKIKSYDARSFEE